MNQQDETTPGIRWAFDEAVTACFDNMLERSIPQYQVMREACFSVGKRFVTPGSAILDLGCSRGQGLARFVQQFSASNSFTGVEVSAPMIKAAKEFFNETPSVSIIDHDLREGLPKIGAEVSVILSILSLQFIPIEYRQAIVSEVYKALSPGGAFIVVEKILGATNKIDELMKSIYYDLKSSNGYSQDSIDRKKHSLEGVLVPITDAWNRELLTSAGFYQVDCFWRWMNFAGWVAIK